MAGSTAGASMDIITSFSSYWLSTTTQGIGSNCHKNTKQWYEYCRKRIHEKCFHASHKHFAVCNKLSRSKNRKHILH